MEIGDDDDHLQSVDKVYDDMKKEKEAEVHRMQEQCLEYFGKDNVQRLREGIHDVLSSKTLTTQLVRKLDDGTYRFEHRISFAPIRRTYGDIDHTTSFWLNAALTRELESSCSSMFKITGIKIQGFYELIDPSCVHDCGGAIIIVMLLAVCFCFIPCYVKSIYKYRRTLQAGYAHLTVCVTFRRRNPVLAQGVPVGG